MKNNEQIEYRVTKTEVIKTGVFVTADTEILAIELTQSEDFDEDRWFDIHMDERGKDNPLYEVEEA